MKKRFFLNSIGSKVTLLTSSLLLMMIALTIITMMVSESVIQDVIANDNAHLAENIMEKIDLYIYQRIKEIEAFRNNPFIVSYFNENNIQNNGRPTDSTNNTIDEEWNRNNTLFNTIIENELSRHLIEMFVKNSYREYGYQIFGEVLITDQYGSIIALTNKTSDYSQSDEFWWQQTFENGLYVSDIIYDESVDMQGIEVCARIDDSNGTVRGIIKGVLDIGKVIEESRIGLSREFRIDMKLLTKEGRLIYSTEVFEFLKDYSQEDFFPDLNGEKKYFVLNTEKDDLYVYGFSKGIRKFKGLGWILVLTRKLVEILKPTILLRDTVILFLILIVIFAALIAYMLISSIMKPLKEFESGARSIANGNLDYTFSIKQNRELIQLSKTFNKMTLKLKKLYKTLEIKEQKATNLAERLHLSNIDLEQFAYIASHDLQEPLRKIHAFGGLLQDEKMDSLDEEGQKYIEIMQKASNRMSKLIAGLLEYSRINTHNTQIEEVNLVSVLEDVRAILEISISETEANITYPERIALIKGNTLQMTHLFQNLISNAIKFRKPGNNPEITLSTSQDEKEKMLILELQDNGIGIEADSFDEIFKPFRKLHSPSQYAGTGIGLAFCKKIVERHGGRISVSSIYGTGTTFTLMLPLSTRSQDGTD